MLSAVRVASVRTNRRVYHLAKHPHSTNYAPIRDWKCTRLIAPLMEMKTRGRTFWIALTVYAGVCR
jgi:hypothetical protein